MLSSLFAGGDDNTAAGGVGGGQQSDPEAWTLQECSIPVAKIMTKVQAGRCELGFTGLNNQGATCYLNALLQVMYMTPELRNGLFAVDPVELGVDLLDAHVEEQANLQKEGIIEADEGMLEMLTCMGIEEPMAKAVLVAVRNAGIAEAFEYLEVHRDSLQQQLDSKTQEDSKRKIKKPRYIPLELQRLFAELTALNRFSVSTEDLTSKGFQWQSMEGRVQHDAHELNRLLIDALEKSLKKTVGQRLCQELYEGKCVNQILCLGCGQLSERVEQFYDLNLQVVSCNNAVQALHQYCREELLQGDSAYQCDRCRSKQTAYRACKIDRLPSILTISCNRFKIDQSTNWNRVKVTTRSEYPLMMHGLQDCLDQYDLMHRHASDQKKTQPHDDTSHQQQASLNQSMTWIDQMYQAAKEFLDQHPELLPSIGKEVNDEVFEASLLSHSFPANAVKSFKETILKSSSTNAYQLHGIIVHQGTAYSGHYYAYIHDTLQHANQEVAKKQLLENLTKHVKKNTCTLLHEKSQTASTNAANAPVAASVDQAVFNHSHPLPTPVVTVAAAPEMVVPDFLFNEDLGTYVVDENTALGYVIQALLQYQQQYQISKSEISSASKASKKPNQVKKGSGKGQSQTTSSANDANSRYVTSSWIVEEVGKSSFGNDKSWWISLYQDHFHGISFDDYLQQFRDSLMDVVIWTVRGKQEIRFAMKDNTSVLLLSSDDLRSMFGEIAVNSAAATTAAVTSQQDDAKVVAALGEVSINDIAVQFPATSAFTNNGEDGWQVVRKEHVKENQNQKPNKKQKKFKKDKNQSSTENPDTKESSDVVDQQASRLNLQECYMIESLLHEVFGRYLQFNDQYVNCMSYQDLYDCFVGVNSAYLLIYRLTSSVPTTISNIPKYWHEKIAEQNQLLLRERQDYEVGASRITVNCFLQSNFNYQYPFFQVSATEEGETLVPMKLEVDANTSVLQIIRQVLESTVSHDGENRTQRSEQQLGDLFMSQFSLDNSINSDSYTVDEMISFLHLSKVEHIQNKFYYPLDPLAHESFAKDVIQSSNALLLWMQPLTTTLSTSLSNAFSFRDVVDGRICFGREQRPRLIGLKSLQTVSNRSTAFKTVVNKKKSSSNLPIGQKILCPLQCEERFCYVPAHFTMLQSVQYMLYLWHVHAHTSSLSSSNVTSAWPYFLSKDKFLERILFLPSPTLGETDIKDTDALLQWIDHAMVHLCLPSLSCFDDSKDVTTNVSKKSTSTTGNTDAGNWTVIFKEGSVQTSNSLLAYSSSTYFGDLLSLCSLRDVYLEDERQQGVHSDSLLKRYLELQQQASYQTVYLDVDRSFMQVWSVQTNGEDFSIASETITLKLPALKNVSLYAFKEEVLALFGDSGLEMMPFAQLRLLDDDNEDQQSVLLSDDLTITQASSSTKDNIRMRLVYVANDQLASLKSKDSNQSANIMKLTVVFKCASATLVKTEEIIKRCLKINSEQLPQAENHFEADDMKIQVEVRPTDHIKRIRDIVGILLFDFPEGWTSYEHDKTSLEDFCVRSKQQLSSDPTGTEEEKLKLFRESSLINFEEFGGWRFRKTSWLGEAGHLVTEAASPSGNNNTTASFVTVADCQLQDGDVLWLESGKVPMPNAVSLPLYVWMPFLQQAEESVRSLADISMSKSADEVYSNRKHCYYFVGELNTTWTASMDDLYAEAMIMLQQKSNMISRDVISWNEIAPKEMQDFLLREIRLDWLLGRSFPSSWDATAADGIVKGNTTVKKLGLKSEKSLAIEIHHIIAIPRNISRASGAFRVWIQRLMNPSSISQGGAVLTPLFPPHEICVQGGSNPLIGHLVRPINVLYADLTVSNLVLYRYHAPTFEWIHFFSPLPSGSKALNKNITQAPYNIREGDLFAVFSMQEAASPIISSRSTSKSKLAPRDQNTAIEVEISSPEDMQLKKLREEAKRKKEEQDQQEKEQQVGGKDGKKGKAKHRPEQALVIHSHLDDDFDDN